MKAFVSATARFLAQIWDDAMLAALAVVPVFMGLLFRFGVPALDSYLRARLRLPVMLVPYYPIFDLLLIILTPVMFTAAGAMVILTETDAGIARAVSVTPVGRRGYLLSRVGVPALAAALYAAGAVAVFGLSGLGAARVWLLSLCAGVLGAAVALMIASMAKNKVEGLAYSKLSGLFVLGLPVALLVPSPMKYLSGILPTFWMTELAAGGSLLLALPALITAGAWTALFALRFSRKNLR